MTSKLEPNTLGQGWVECVSCGKREEVGYWLPGDDGLVEFVGLPKNWMVDVGLRDSAAIVCCLECAQKAQ